MKGSAAHKRQREVCHPRNSLGTSLMVDISDQRLGEMKNSSG